MADIDVDEEHWTERTIGLSQYGDAYVPVSTILCRCIQYIKELRNFALPTNQYFRKVSDSHFSV